MLIPFNVIVRKYNMLIHGVLHIGALRCEELIHYRNYGLTNDKIIWIEANPRLVQNIRRMDKTIIIKNFICCDRDTGITRLNISNNNQSSSILELGSHRTSYPDVKYVGYVDMKNNRIDTMYKNENIPKNFANFLTIDIQGAELMALKGMGDILHYFDYVYVEVNRDYVYRRCPLVTEIDNYLSQYNLIRVETKWTKENWGDALYIKIKNI